MEEITARQKRILDFIRDRVRERGYPPTVREIGEAVGLTSSSSVHAQLANLERRGLLRRDPTKPRAMGLREEEPEAPVSIPLLGHVAAGGPALAEHVVEGYLSIPPDFGGEEGHFALRVRGESMTGAGILPGDVVIVRRQDSADEGDVVVALQEGPGESEATVKRLRRRNGRVLLVPEHPAMEPIEGDDARILGKVVGVLRRL